MHCEEGNINLNMPKQVGIFEGEIVFELDKIKPKELKRFKVILKCTILYISDTIGGNANNVVDVI
jgi:hypothetical protein